MADIDYSIKDIEKLVKLDGEIKNVEVSRLTAPGENYMSLVLKVDFKVEKDGKSKIVSTVAKRNPMGQRKNDFGDFMKSEIKFYTEILPLLQDFAKECGIGELDFFPEYCASRYTYDPEVEQADANSFLLLENLIPNGYKNENRQKGFDLITSKAILKRLALLNSIPIAIKHKRPDSFKIIKEFLWINMRETGNKDGEKPGSPPGTISPGERVLDIMINMPECSQYVDRLKTHQGKFLDPSEWFKSVEGPWSTLLHADFWVNNIMIKPREGEEPLVKFVDFQVNTYGSYVRDLVFFVLLSVQDDVVKNYMDDLLRYYYEEFTSTLKKAKVDLELTFTAFLKEIKRIVHELEFQHLLFFTIPVIGDKNPTLDPALEEFNPNKHLIVTKETMIRAHKDKLVLIATEAGQRNWI